MRSKNRIKPVLKVFKTRKILIEFLMKHLVQLSPGQLTLDDMLRMSVAETFKIPDSFEDFWLNNPDLRMGQGLIENDLLPDTGELFYVEETDWLKQRYPRQWAEVNQVVSL